MWDRVKLDKMKSRYREDGEAGIGMRWTKLRIGMKFRLDIKWTIKLRLGRKLNSVWG